MSTALAIAAPCIRKAGRLLGKTLALRDASIADAEFIFALRTDERKAAHLSRVSSQLADQQDWLKRYAQRDGEAYFIIERLADAEPLGTVRLYDAQGESFCWGSWILKDGAPSSAAIESALMVYAYAIDGLGFSRAHFQVQRENERVWAFHERFGAQRTAERPDEYEYTLPHDAIRASMQRYGKFLPAGVTQES